MGIFIDIVIVAILLLSVIMGYKKGLVNVIFNLCAFLVAIIITVILYKPIAGIVINNTQIDENIEQTIIEKGTSEKEENTDEASSLDKYIEKYVQDAAVDAKNEAVQIAAKAIAVNVVNIITAILLFIIVRIALIFVKFLVEALAELPIIKQFNKAGGILYGALRGLIIIYVLLAILFFIVFVNNNIEISSAIDSSIITKYLYGNNIILNVLF